MLLDFNNLTSDQKISIDQIFFKFQDKFENLINDIYKNNQNNIDLFFSNIISRNHDENEIYYSLCLIQLALILKKKKKISKIITKNKAQERILKQIINNIDINCKEKRRNIFLKNIFQVFKNTHYLFKLWISKNNKRKNKIKNSKNITLIDIFFIPKMFLNNTFKDRYYGDLINWVENDQYNIFFFPNIFHKAIQRNFINLAEKKINIILQSDFLKLKDYLKSLFFFRRVKNFNLKNIYFEGLNIEDLIRNELNNNKFSQPTLISLLNFFCFKRMKEEKVDLRQVIDWYENQIVDKGFNYGKNYFFPKIVSKGYLGLNSILEINPNFIPSKFEISKNISPKKICLISPKYFKIYKKNKKDIEFCLAPAFRNQNLFDQKYLVNKNIKNNNVFKILINFTGFHFDNLEMINFINKCEILKSEQISVFIRPHQESKKDVFKKISKEIKYYFSEKNFYDEMKNTDILISRSSTACFESLIFGVPVLITRRVGGFLPIKNHESFPSNLWFFNNDPLDLEHNIKKIISNKNKYYLQNLEERQKLLKDYFYPISKENITNFLR